MRFSPPGRGRGTPLHRLYRYVQRQRVWFLAFLVDVGYQFRPFWSEIGFGLCTLVLNWVCFLEETTSSSFGDRTISLFMFLRQSCTSRNSLSDAPVTRRAPGPQVWIRVGKITDFGLNWGKGFRKRAHTPINFSGSTPRGFSSYFIHKWGVNVPGVPCEDRGNWD